MRSLHVISSIRPEAGGPSYSVPRLVEGLNSKGQQATIATLAANLSCGTTVEIFRPDWVPLKIFKKLGRSDEMVRGLTRLGGDLVHAHGLWTMSNIYSAHYAQNLGVPFIISPRGMLGAEALKFSRNVKKIFHLIWQRHALSCVDCFHATAPSEVDDIRAFGLTAPIAVVRNGIDLPECSADRVEKTSPFILALSRLHPKKGLNLLVEAFARVAQDFPAWRLRIVGIDENGYHSVLARCIKEAHLESRASIEAAVFGPDKYRLLGQASLFALPSLHENFGICVAESLAAGTPVIASKGAPWSGLEVHRAGWWVDHGVDSLEACLRKAMALPEAARAEMGQRGKDWMRRDFSWDGVADDMTQVYEWLLGRRARPDFVVM